MSSSEVFEFSDKRFAILPTTMSNGDKVWWKWYSVVEQWLEKANFNGIPECQIVYRAYMPDIKYKGIEVMRRYKKQGDSAKV